MGDPMSWPFVTATASTAAPTQLELAGLKEAIDKMNRSLDQESAALRALFAEHGYDLANGDVLYHGPEIAFMVPPQYRAQVVQHPTLEGKAMWFAKNPRFSLF
jgi:hypothetical protein